MRADFNRDVADREATMRHDLEVRFAQSKPGGVTYDARGIAQALVRVGDAVFIRHFPSEREAACWCQRNGVQFTRMLDLTEEQQRAILFA